MTEEQLERANNISRNMDKLRRVVKYKCDVEATVLKDVIELLGDDFYKLVNEKFRQLNNVFKKL